MINDHTDHGYPSPGLRQACIACGSGELYCCDGNGRKLTPAMRALYRDCLRWGEVGPDAEDAAGCHGAAFNAVLQGLIDRGYMTPNGEVIR